MLLEVSDKEFDKVCNICAVHLYVWVSVCVWCMCVYVVYVLFSGFIPNWLRYKGSSNSDKKRKSKVTDERVERKRKDGGKEEGGEGKRGRNTYLPQRDTQLVERGWQWQTSTESETESHTIETTPQHTYRCTAQILHTLSNSLSDTSSSTWILFFTWDNFSP